MDYAFNFKEIPGLLEKKDKYLQEIVSAKERMAFAAKQLKDAEEEYNRVKDDFFGQVHLVCIERKIHNASYDRTKYSFNSESNNVLFDLDDSTRKKASLREILGDILK